MKYSITLTGSGTIDEILKSLLTVAQEIHDVKDSNPDDLDGYEYENPTILVGLYEE